jgi:hypothetical protein
MLKKILSLLAVTSRNNHFSAIHPTTVGAVPIPSDQSFTPSSTVDINLNSWPFSSPEQKICAVDSDPATAENTPYHPFDQSSAVEKNIEDICSTEPFEHLNKPSNMRLEFLGEADTTIGPAVCRYSPPPNKECLDAKVRYSFFMQSLDPEFFLRARHNQKPLVAKEGLQILKFAPLDKEQKIKFSAYIDQLELLEDMLLSEQYSKKLNMGFCRESADNSALKIIRSSPSSKVQKVIVSRGRYDHAFLLIDSEVGCTQILDNRREVRKVLKTLEGTICDAWNAGYYKKTKSNTNNLYLDADSLRITPSLSSTFDISNLPKKAADFIKNKLKQFELDHLIVDSDNDPQNVGSLTPK